jgi:hypothetical protein
MFQGVFFFEKLSFRNPETLKGIKKMTSKDNNNLKIKQIINSFTIKHTSLQSLLAPLFQFFNVLFEPSCVHSVSTNTLQKISVGTIKF